MRVIKAQEEVRRTTEDTWRVGGGWRKVLEECKRVRKQRRRWLGKGKKEGGGRGEEDSRRDTEGRRERVEEGDVGEDEGA